MNRLFLLSILSLALYACGGKVKKPTEPEIQNTKTDTPDMALPIADLLRDDMRKVDSFATGIVKKTNVNGKTDSGFVKLPVFHRLADQFLLKEFDSAYFQDHFTEESLMDETTGMLNFIYTPKNGEPSLRRIVVYLKPSLSVDNIERIYFETSSSQNDTLVEKRYTWKMRQYFYILTKKQPASGSPVTTMEKLIWDPQHFADN